LVLNSFFDYDGKTTLIYESDPWTEKRERKRGQQNMVGWNEIFNGPKELHKEMIKLENKTSDDNQLHIH
jgi:hypothetical protein